jgi:hypothetical protein
MGISLKQYEVYKISKERLRYSIQRKNKHIQITKEDAIKSQEIVRLFDNQAFRSIIRITKSNEMINYVAIIECNNGTELKKVASGIYINGKKFKRFLGSTGGLKDNKVIFVSEDIYDELNAIANNGRQEKAIVPAKLESYRALMFSSSTPIAQPKKILVVSDVFTQFVEDIYEVNEEKDTYEGFTVTEKDNVVLENNSSDGYSLCTVDYMKKVSKSLGLDYMTSGVCLRGAFLKGMMFPFDIVEFFEEHNVGYVVKDIWGNDIDIRDVDIITTESSLKLWYCYDSIDDYMKNCKKNKFEFSATKVIDEELEEYRETNYQYLQDYELSYEDVKELCSDTVEILTRNYCGRYKDTLKFLGIDNIDNINYDNMKNDWQKALLTNEYMLNDKNIQQQVNKMISKKINNAKMGRLIIRGCYAIVCADVVTLMQKICGLEVTGLLKKNEVYCDYWNKRCVKEVLSFRSPMLCMSNITKDILVNTEETRRWYKHMKNVYIYNAFDGFQIRHEGCDNDSDAVISTDNEVLLRRYREEKLVNFIQKSVDKVIPTEKDLIKSNIDCFDNSVGKITNKITSIVCKMYEFDKNSDEYKELKRRLIASNGVQQSIIDKCKGIATNGMPKHWYSLKHCKTEFDKKICVINKPYFFKYNYKRLKTENNTVSKNKKIKSLIVDNDKCFTPNKDKVLFDNDCTMNKIAHYIEDVFQEHKLLISDNDFDYKKIRTNNFSYEECISKIKEFYKEIGQLMSDEFKSTMNTSDNAGLNGMYSSNLSRDNYCKEKIYEICNNSKTTVLNAIIECLYTGKISQRFAYAVAGDLIIKRVGEI